MTERRILYQYPLCPFCRKVRLVLFEKGLSYSMVFIEPFSPSFEFLKTNPLGEVPVLIEPDSHSLFDSISICEYLNEIKTLPDLLGETPRGRAEVRRLVNWFDRAFYIEVYKPIMTEKVIKLLKNKLEPDAKIIRAGRQNLKRHLEYLDWLAGRKSYLAGRNLSLADLTAAAHISILDYLGEINWDDYHEASSWYSKIKSRPSFDALLKDRIAGIPPSERYADLDF